MLLALSSATFLFAEWSTSQDFAIGASLSSYTEMEVHSIADTIDLGHYYNKSDGSLNGSFEIAKLNTRSNSPEGFIITSTGSRNHFRLKHSIFSVIYTLTIETASAKIPANTIAQQRENGSESTPQVTLLDVTNTSSNAQSNTLTDLSVQLTLNSDATQTIAGGTYTDTITLAIASK